MGSLKELVQVASSLNILYVEDDRDIANTVVTYLSKIFETVIYVGNGKDALSMYSEHLNSKDGNSFDIVLSDINMPEMNGIVLAREIKKLNKNQAIIFMTAHSEKEILQEAIKIGVDGYIVKPVDFEQTNDLLLKVSRNVKSSYENNINLEQQNFLMNHISEKNTLLKQYSEVINKVAIISKTDLAGNITYANELFYEVSGYSKDEVIGKKHNIVRHPDMNPSVYAEMWNTISNGMVWEGTIKNLAKDGSPYYVHATIIPEIVDTKVSSYVGIRFLSTDEEVEKREFKRKVRTTIQEYKKSNFELSKQVKELSTELEARKKDKDMNALKVIELENKLEKALFEVSHYEKAFTTKEESKYDVMQNYKNNLNDMTTKYQDAVKELKIARNEVVKFKLDNNEKKVELLKVNEKLIEQRKIIEDLKGTFKNKTVEKEVEKPIKKNIFSIFK